MQLPGGRRWSAAVAPGLRPILDGSHLHRSGPSAKWEQLALRDWNDTAIVFQHRAAGNVERERRPVVSWSNRDGRRSGSTAARQVVVNYPR